MTVPQWLTSSHQATIEKLLELVDIKDYSTLYALQQLYHIDFNISKNISEPFISLLVDEHTRLEDEKIQAILKLGALPKGLYFGAVKHSNHSLLNELDRRYGRDSDPEISKMMARAAVHSENEDIIKEHLDKHPEDRKFILLDATRFNKASILSRLGSHSCERTKITDAEHIYVMSGELLRGTSWTNISRYLNKHIQTPCMRKQALMLLCVMFGLKGFTDTELNTFLANYKNLFKQTDVIPKSVLLYIHDGASRAANEPLMMKLEAKIQEQDPSTSAISYNNAFNSVANLHHTALGKRMFRRLANLRPVLAVRGFFELLVACLEQHMYKKYLTDYLMLYSYEPELDSYNQAAIAFCASLTIQNQEASRYIAEQFRFSLLDKSHRQNTSLLQFAMSTDPQIKSTTITEGEIKLLYSMMHKEIAPSKTALPDPAVFRNFLIHCIEHDLPQFTDYLLTNFQHKAKLFFSHPPKSDDAIDIDMAEAQTATLNDTYIELIKALTLKLKAAEDKKLAYNNLNNLIQYCPDDVTVQARMVELLLADPSNIPSIKEFLKTHPQVVKYQDPATGNSLLHIANDNYLHCSPDDSQNYLAFIELLLSMNADITKPNEEKISPFAQAPASTALINSKGNSKAELLSDIYKQEAIIQCLAFNGRILALKSRKEKLTRRKAELTQQQAELTPEQTELTKKLAREQAELTDKLAFLPRLALTQEQAEILARLKSCLRTEPGAIVEKAILQRRYMTTILAQRSVSENGKLSYADLPDDIKELILESVMKTQPRGAKEVSGSEKADGSKVWFSYSDNINNMIRHNVLRLNPLEIIVRDDKIIPTNSLVPTLFKAPPQTSSPTSNTNVEVATKAESSPKFTRQYFFGNSASSSILGAATATSDPTEVLPEAPGRACPQLENRGVSI